MSIGLLIGQNLAPRAQVQPHPTVEGGWTVNDPRLSGDLRLLFASKQRAESFAVQRNLRIERNYT